MADAFLNLPLHPNVWLLSTSTFYFYFYFLFRFSGAAGSDALQCLMHLTAFRFSGAARTLGAAAAAGGSTLALSARFTYTSSCIFPVGAVSRALPGQASGQLGCCDVADAFLILPLHLHVWHSCSSSCSLFRFSGAAGSDVLQCLMHLLCSASLVRPGLRALSTSSMCVRSPACIASGSMSLTLWPAAMVGSQECRCLQQSGTFFSPL